MKYLKDTYMICQSNYDSLYQDPWPDGICDETFHPKPHGLMPDSFCTSCALRIYSFAISSPMHAYVQIGFSH